MKKLIQQLIVLCCAAALTLGLSVTSFAAAATYTIHADGDQLQVLQGDEEVASYTLKSSDLTLKTVKARDNALLLNFKDSTSTTRNISLGNQSAIAISGTLNSLTVNAAIQVIVADDAKLGQITCNDKVASVQTASGKAVVASAAKPSTTTKSTVRRPDKTTATTSTQMTLNVKPLTAGEDQTLADLQNQLNSNVVAIDKTTKVVIPGECQWVSGGRTQIRERTSNPAFVFYPTDQAYAPVKGTIRVNAMINAEQAILHFDGGNTLYAQDGDRLSSLNKQLKDILSVEDSEGNSISYTIQWKNASGIRFSAGEGGRSYSFTVKPTSSNYLSVDGTVSVVVED